MRVRMLVRRSRLSRFWQCSVIFLGILSFGGSLRSHLELFVGQVTEGVPHALSHCAYTWLKVTEGVTKLATRDPTTSSYTA